MTTLRRASLRALAGAALALAAAFAVPTAASADENGSPNGLPADVRAMGAVVPLREDDRERALAVYEGMLPAGLEMPDEPEVGVWLAHLSTARYHALRPQDPLSNWLEGAILLRVRHGSEEGWYPVHYPVTGEFWFHAGRATGLPKRRADAEIVPAGDGWHGTAVPRALDGVPSIDMTFSPQEDGDAEAADRGLRLAQDPMFVLNAPFAGPKITRVQYDINPPYPLQTALPLAPPAWSPGATPQAGSVELRLRPELDAINEDLPKVFGDARLSDLIDLEATVPGAHALFAVTVNSSSRDVGQGGYGG